MKWSKRPNSEGVLDKEGSVRHKRRFLFFPKTIRQEKVIVTRWLEMATWTEVWHFTYYATLRGSIEVGRMPSNFEQNGTWRALHWIDAEETAEQALEKLPLWGSKK